MPLVACILLEYYLWGALGIPNLRVLSLLILLISISHRKLENFNHTKLNKTFMRSVSIRKQIPTISIVANQFIFFSCIISTVFQLFYGKNSSKKRFIIFLKKLLLYPIISTIYIEQYKP